MVMMKEMTSHGNTKMTMVGDFNIKNINWEHLSATANEEQLEHKFIECVRDLYLYQHVKQAIRYRNYQTANILDLIFSNEENLVVKVQHRTSLGSSDHLIFTFNVNCDLKQQVKGSTSKLNINKAYWSLINEDLYTMMQDDTSDMDI